MKSDKLKHKVFKVADRQSSVADFEQWLYDQSDLFGRIEDPLIFELYDFNYKQKEAQYVFRHLIFKFFSEKEFMEWKILDNLNILAVDSNRVHFEQILNDFYENQIYYPFLSELGYMSLQVGEWGLYGMSENQYYQKVRNAATKLLSRISEWKEDCDKCALIEFKC